MKAIISRLLTKIIILGVCVSSLVHANSAINSKKKIILNLHHSHAETGGIENHLRIFNKVFADNGIENIVLTSKNSTYMVNNLTTFKTYNHNDYNPRKEDVTAICQEYDVSTIVCNTPYQINLCLGLNIPIIYVHHHFRYNFSPDEINHFNHVQGIVTVSPIVGEYLQNLQRIGTLKVKHVIHCAPFWDDATFLMFKPTRTKEQFFKEEFNLDLTDQHPIISMVAMMYWCKNQAVLLKAADLLRKQNKTFHIMLAGDGEDEPMLKNLAKDLKLDACVHFIGKTFKVAELLYHSDIHLLSSSHESFGLVHLEAATMKKPFIAATETGAGGFIQNGITGLIFENNNVQALAKTLTLLIDQPKLRTTLGEKAYKFVQDHYTTEALFQIWKTFLHDVQTGTI